MKPPSGGHLAAVRLYWPCCRNSKRQHKKALQLLQCKAWHLCSVSPSLAGEEKQSDFVLKLLSDIYVFPPAICLRGETMIPVRETWEIID